jgi:hypothetical protein
MSRTLADLAQEAIQIQDACNLSGLVHGWSRAITELREIMPTAGTSEINRHPINKLWAYKVYSLACHEDMSDRGYEEFKFAYNWCKEHSK